MDSRSPPLVELCRAKSQISSARREKQVQVIGHGKSVAHYAIQMAADTRLALYLFQFVDSSDASQFERKESTQQNWIFLIKGETV